MRAGPYPHHAAVGERAGNLQDRRLLVVRDIEHAKGLQASTPYSRRRPASSARRPRAALRGKLLHQKGRRDVGAVQGGEHHAGHHHPRKQQLRHLVAPTAGWTRSHSEGRCWPHRITKITDVLTQSTARHRVPTARSIQFIACLLDEAAGLPARLGVDRRAVCAGSVGARGVDDLLHVRADRRGEPLVDHRRGRLLEHRPNRNLPGPQLRTTCRTVS